MKRYLKYILSATLIVGFIVLLIIGLLYAVDILATNPVLGVFLIVIVFGITLGTVAYYAASE